MHATYSFLLSIDNDAADIPAAADGAFDSLFNNQLDDNNWYQPEALILKDGRAFQMCEKDDWRGRGCLLDETISPILPADRWQWAMHFALSCVAIDLHLFGTSGIALGEQDSGAKKIDGSSWDDLVAAIEDELPRRLSNAYSEIVGKKKLDAFDLKEYERAKDAVRFEAFRNSERKPFTDNGHLTPYNYRCFDLTNGEEPNAVLLVDIHT